ncbi:MAG: hypothetical protein ACI4QE_05005, partial [Acutalibacteraceae bacterium]
GNWYKTIGGLFFLVAIYLFIMYIETLLEMFLPGNQSSFQKDEIIFIFCISLFVFLTVILTLPLLTGYFRLCCNIVNKRQASVGDIFYYFKSFSCFKKALSLNIRILFRVFIVLCASMVIPTAIKLSEKIFPALASFLNIFSIVLMVLSVVFTVFYAVRFLMAQYIFIENQELESYETMHIYKDAIKGNNSNYILLLISFTPLILLCFFVVPAIFVIPYIFVSFANSTKWLMMIFKRKNEENSDDRITMRNSI